MAGPEATARSPALRWSVPASDLDLFLSALGALTWGLGRSPGPLVDLCDFRRSATVPMGRSSGPGAPPS